MNGYRSALYKQPGDEWTVSVISDGVKTPVKPTGELRFTGAQDKNILVGNVIVGDNVRYLVNTFKNSHATGIESVKIGNSVENCQNMFCLANNFNGAVTISNSVTDCSNMFSGAGIYNRALTIPNNVTNASYMFNGCTRLNQPITFGNSVTNATGMFNNCTQFNQSVTFPNSLVGTLTRTFGNCTSYNKDITIPDGVTSTVSMLDGCTNFNGNVVIGNGVTNSDNMFNGCTSFNGDITIGSGLTSLNNFLRGCTAYNHTTNIPGSVRSCYSMFYGCKSLNQNIDIPYGVTNCSHMFEGCNNFYMGVTMGNSVTDCSYMFANSSWHTNNYNLPDSITNCSYMFRASDMSMALYNGTAGRHWLPSNVVNVCGMFAECENLNNAMFTLPASVNDCTSMFANCKNIGTNNQLFLVGGHSSITNISNMFYGCSGGRVRISNSLLYKVQDMSNAFRNAAMPYATYDNYPLGTVFRISNNMSNVRNAFRDSTYRVYTIYVDRNSPFDCADMLTGSSNLYETEVFCNDSKVGDIRNIISENDWTAIGNGNGYYSASRNLYLVNHWN